MPTNDVLSLTGQFADHRWNIQTDLGTAAVATYSFPTTIPSYLTGSDRFGWEAFTASHQARVRAALDEWSNYGGISFVEVPEDIGGAIQFHFVDISDQNPFDLFFTAGYAYLPYGNFSYDADLNRSVERVVPGNEYGDVFMNADAYSLDKNAFAQSRDGYGVLLHEIGHAVGLKHPFEGDVLIDPANDNWDNTVMTYGDSDNDGTIGTIDIQALDYLYGTHDLNASWHEEREAVVQHGSDESAGEVLTGWAYNDMIYSNDGDDTVFGLAGDDRVYGGSGDDTVYLSYGNDYMRAKGGADAFYGGEGKDYISYYDSTNGVNVNLDTNEISGGMASNDIISDFESGSGSRTGNDVFYGTTGANTIRTYGGKDSVYARSGNDKIELGSGNDYVRVGGGVEEFYGGSGRDYISYYDSANGVRLDLRDDEASRSWASNDVISDFESASGSKTGGDLLLGTNGATKFRGYGGDDTIYGRSGDDKLYGGDGDDFFDGGADTDTLYGGAGRDVFHFDKGEDVDFIKDFENNIDTIELDGFASDFNAFAYAEQVGDDVVFDFAGDDLLTVENTSINALLNDLILV